MSAAGRIGLFAVVLAAAFGAAYLAGGAVDPDVDDAAPAHAGGERGGAERARHSDAADHRRPARTGHGDPARLLVDDRRFEAGVRQTLSFRVVDGAGRAVENFDVEHEREMHVIAVRRDLTGYQHVHPRRTADGRWEVAMTFPDGGPHRIFADFASAGKAHTLDADIDVRGSYAPRPLPPPARVASAGDGYRVHVARAGDERRFTVSKDGRVVDDIEPYLGARGHLVALRAGSLAFEHVHPKDRATAGRSIRFDVALPERGGYRLFLQFKHDGVVRTAAFTERVAHGSAGHGEDGHGH